MKKNAIPVYIDYSCESNIPKIDPSDSLKVIKRHDYRYWRVMKSKTKIINQNDYLWKSLEFCIKETSLNQDEHLVFEKKRVIKIINKLLIKLTALPLFNTYPIRKILYSIDINDFEALGCKNTAILKRNVPYSKQFNLSNIPLNKKYKK